MSSDGLARLTTWKKAKDFTVLIYMEAVTKLPPEEKWGLASQLRRSAASIPANIAEGYRRFYYQENIRFCYIARGSLEETLSHLILTHDLSYLPTETFQKLVGRGDELVRMINGYIEYLKRSRQGANEPGATYEINERTGDEYFELPDASIEDPAD